MLKGFQGERDPFQGPGCEEGVSKGGGQFKGESSTDAETSRGVWGTAECHFAVEKERDFSLKSRVGQDPDPKGGDVEQFLLQVP